MNEVRPGVFEGGTAFVIAPPRHITAYAFKARFTAAERIAIRTAAASSAAVADWLDLADTARYIDLDMAATRTGVQALETAGLLSSGRALEILDAVVLDSERP